MTPEFDICIIGSGAGAGPIAYELSLAKKQVLVLEKGPWFTEKDFTKDEITATRRSYYTPNLMDEPQVLEQQNEDGTWEGESNYDSGWDFWNGSLVGGSSNFMSGFFHRMKPEDFRLLSEFGPIEGANIVDWPITYEDLEPYYAKVESVVGVSGRVIDHPNQEPRSTKDFPYPPTQEHPISQWFDKACRKMGLYSLPVPRAILSQPDMNRNACSYTNYCGSYGCTTGAKGSARAALLNHAIKTGFCEIRPHAKVFKLENDSEGKVSAVHYFDKKGNKKKVTAKIYVTACSAIESARLLLLSSGPKHPNGLANNHNLVGKNLIFSGGGSGGGDLLYKEHSESEITSMKIRGLFVNRALHDFYFINDKSFGGPAKGGIVEFMFRHANPIARANSLKWGEDGLVWGKPLKRKLESYFTESRHFRFEIFNDWLPTDNCFVSLDDKVKDKWGTPVAKIRLGYHEHDLKVGRYIAEKSEAVLRQMGAKEIYSGISGDPPSNLTAGGCRFGNDPATSVLDPDCRAHDVENLYVTDGSFMPTGGSVPYTWTIYANSFRVADKIKSRLD